jgi:hypothetical protein
LFKDAQRFAKRTSAGLKHGYQIALGGQFIARLETAVENRPFDLRDQVFEEPLLVGFSKHGSLHDNGG